MPGGVGGLFSDGESYPDMNSFPKTAFFPYSKIMINRFAWWEIIWMQLPSTSSLQNIQYGRSGICFYCFRCLTLQHEGFLMTFIQLVKKFYLSLIHDVYSFVKLKVNGKNFRVIHHIYILFRRGSGFVQQTFCNGAQKARPLKRAICGLLLYEWIP